MRDVPPIALDHTPTNRETLTLAASEGSIAPKLDR